MAKSKVKRYNDEGYVTSEDSNAGMKEAYDEDALKRTNASETSAQETETSAPTNFKSAFAAARKAGVKTFEFGGKKYNTELASEKASSRTGGSTQYGAKTPTIGASGTYGKGLGRRSHPEYPEDASKAMVDKKRDFKSNPPSALSRAFSAIRERGMKSNPDAYSKGGSASSRADGIAQRGKTRGKIY